MSTKRWNSYYTTYVKRYTDSFIKWSVEAFSNLPEASSVDWQFRYVINTTWSWILWTQKKKGIYLSTWWAWEYVDSPLAATTDEVVAGLANDVYVSPYTLEQVFWNIDNTSDANKPVSTATQTALNNLQALINASVEESFETINKNLMCWSKQNNYDINWRMTSVVFTSGSLTITKALNRTWDKLTSVVLSWDTPSWISLTRTNTYSWDSLINQTYS